MSRIVVLVLVALTACTTHDQQIYANIDQTNKSMLIAPGSLGLLGEIKRALVSDGWQLIVMDGMRVTEGSTTPTVQLSTGTTFTARYRLEVRDTGNNYDISIVDLRNGSEVVTLNGRSSTLLVSNAAIAQRLMAAIQAASHGNAQLRIVR